MHNPPRILVVDDSPANVEILQMRLQAQGYAILTASDGEEALSAVFEHQPDFVQDISEIVAARQAEMASRLAEAPDAAAPQKEPLLARVKRYFGMD